MVDTIVKISKNPPPRRRQKKRGKNEQYQMVLKKHGRKEKQVNQLDKKIFTTLKLKPKKNLDRLRPFDYIYLPPHYPKHHLQNLHLHRRRHLHHHRRRLLLVIKENERMTLRM